MVGMCQCMRHMQVLEHVGTENYTDIMYIVICIYCTASILYQSGAHSRCFLWAPDLI